ncbi:type VI secretion system ATPase TssH [Paracandidimonas soli]|uniref:Type VI secretion system protein VasG n=2 Tax=Pseudomonadota TaxID=1224 RepID=A0A4R3UQR7_9BURK|nr:type VI secretion system ATPase TssH [Paracandidimonas soli]TCU93007.1 type VI secretion system protein VasG [Paracandidimonas soli]
MSDINRAELFERLNPVLMESLQSAVSFCKIRGNPYVELAHWLHQLLQRQENDLWRIVRHFGMDDAALAADLLRALESLPRGAASVSDFSAHIDDAVERAWLYASVKYGAQRIRGGHLLAGLMKTPAHQRMLASMSNEWNRIVPDVLVRSLPDIVAGSTEDDAAFAGSPAPGAPLSEERGLRKYGQDLTAKAEADELDPVTGREAEIRQMVDVLLRRRQNNPLMVGDAGVGKTAVVEGLAIRLAAGDVPPALQGVRLWLLDMGALQAGAGVKGEFESRLREVIEDVQDSPVPIVLFIDEIHTLVGAGGAQGTSDAANLLKPALARGQLRTIGATTWSEYKRHIERDPALTRRFQAIQVEEPDEEKAIAMLRGVALKLSGHHGILLLEEAIESAVRLSHRYIPSRQLPDKAIALLDTACARTAVSQHAQPPVLEDVCRRIALQENVLRSRGREVRIGLAREGSLQALEQELGRLCEERDALRERWSREMALAQELCELRQVLMGTGNDADGTSRSRLDALTAELDVLQKERPLIHPAVTGQVVAEVVSDWTGIPVGRVMKDQARTVLDLADMLSQRVLGQRHALEAIAHRVQISRARLEDPGKPVGVFLLCGPSGTGKTETALALAEALYGGEQNLITINMSEFQESHTVSTLKGAPPGYIGYGEGGVLTEAVRRRPHSVVLLDEIEKAHPDVHEMFFQVFDKGWMEDGEGRHIDFRNTLILLTSNVGSEAVARACHDESARPDPETLGDVLRRPLLQAFPAALLGRLSVVPYYPLTQSLVVDIAKLRIGKVAQRLREHHGMTLRFEDSAYDLLLARCAQWESGARMIDAILNAEVLPSISRHLLESDMHVTERGADAQDETARPAVIRVEARDGHFAHDVLNEAALAEFA